MDNIEDFADLYVDKTDHKAELVSIYKDEIKRNDALSDVRDENPLPVFVIFFVVVGFIVFFGFVIQYVCEFFMRL